MAEQASAVSATSRDEGGTHRTFPPALGHRPEIDGLRSLAILPILLLHCGVSALAGGYIGVDIFFVISGYLITAIVMREVVAGSFSLVDFYRRRIVRILPALVVMIAVVLAAGCVLLFPVELRKLGQSAAATAAFGSNIYFYLTIDYFSSDTNPLVHTWSLAVEEQFYLLYPLLLIALQRAQRRSIIGLFVVLSVISFAIGGYLAFRDPSAAFYLLPSRIWELLLGGLVALGRTATRLSQRHVTEPLRLSIGLCATYWHFLLLAWVILFALLAYSPSLLWLYAICTAPLR